MVANVRLCLRFKGALCLCLYPLSIQSRVLLLMLGMFYLKPCQLPEHKCKTRPLFMKIQVLYNNT